MKLSLLVWATSALASPCKPGTAPGYNLPGSLTTGSSPDSTSRAHGQPDQTGPLSGAASTGSVPFVSLPSTSSDIDKIETGTNTDGIPGPDNTQTGVIGTQTDVPGTGVQQPDNTETAVMGTETQVQETQPGGTQTGDVSGIDSSANIPSGSHSVGVPIFGDETSVGAPTGTETSGVPSSIGDQTSADGPSRTGSGDASATVPPGGVPTGTQIGDVPGPVDGDQTTGSAVFGTQTGGLPGIATGETSSLLEASGTQSQGTGSSPVDNPDVTSVPGENNTQTGSGAISSEVPSGEVSESGPVSQTGSDGNVTGGPNPGNTETDSPTDTDPTGGPIPTGPVTEATDVETGLNTQIAPGSSESNEGSQPELTFDTTLPAVDATLSGESQPFETQPLTGNPDDGTFITTEPANAEATAPVNSSTGSEPPNTQSGPAIETTGLGNSQPVESQPADSGAETETTLAEQPQLTESASSDIPSVPAVESTTKPDAGVTDSLPVSTAASDLPPITAAPGVTSAQPPPAPTGTVTEVPADWAPTCVSGHTEWTANTWITTTVDGSSTPTEVPVLVDTEDCDGDGAGLILWGFPHVSGTQFNLPGAPPFSLPCLPPLCSTPPTTGPGNGEEGDDDSSKSDKSTATCTDASTVSNCLVGCTTQVGVETPECTTTCSMTATGCSVTGTTTTTEMDACSATGDASSGCDVCPAEFQAENSDPEAPDDDFDSGSESGLARRWNGPDRNQESRVGNCDAGTFGTSFKFPNYPSGPDIFNNEKDLAKANSPLNAVTRWVWKEMNRNTCRPHAVGLYNEEASWARMKSPTIDHVFEKSFLRDYWRAITRKGARDVFGTIPNLEQNFISCNDLKKYGGISMSLVKDVFMKYPGATQNPGDVIQPSEANFLEDFMGMDEWTNKAKGIVTSPDQITNRNGQIKTYNANSLINPIMAIIAERMDLIYQVIVGVQITNMGISQEIMVRQNTRIYQALQAMDLSAKKNCKEKAVRNGKWSFADRYKDLMTSRFDGTERFSINPRLANSWNVLQTQITADFTAADERITAMPENNERDKTVKANWRAKYDTHYNSWQRIAATVQKAGAPKIVSPEWVWPEPLARRADDNELGFCNVELPTTSGPPTTFSTLVSTSSTDEQTTNSAPEPTSTAILCESDDDCGSMECNDDERSFCSSRLGQMPGMPKFCSCVAKPITTPPPTTTSAEEPKPTTSSIDEGECKTDEDCKAHECREGFHPVCGTGNPMNPSPPFCHCESDPPTSTKPAPPQDTHDPNDDFPEVECSVHADCDKWQGVCPRGNKYCSATDWELVNGVLTSKRAICSC